MIEKEKTNEGTSIKKIIAVMSGKGGVGKSSVTSLIGVALRKKGLNIGILDADITGPSIPRIFGLREERAVTREIGVEPVVTSTGIKVISLNLMMEDEDAPVIWRGPVIAGVVKQFYTDVNWGKLDFLLVDLPPGTGDVPLTIMQSLPVDGVVIVSSPQDMVQTAVRKSIKMVQMMNTPIVGIIENMSYFRCPDSHKDYYIFGKSNVEETATKYNLELLTKLPIDPKFVEMCDEGKIEQYHNEDFMNKDNFLDKLL